MHADAFYNLRKIRNGSGVRNRWPEPETYKTSAVRGGWDRNRNSKTREAQRRRESALQASTYLRLTQFTDHFTLIAMLLPEPRVVPTPPIELDSATVPYPRQSTSCGVTRSAHFSVSSVRRRSVSVQAVLFVVDAEEADVLLTNRDTDGVQLREFSRTSRSMFPNGFGPFHRLKKSKEDSFTREDRIIPAGLNATSQTLSLMEYRTELLAGEDCKSWEIRNDSSDTDQKGLRRIDAPPQGAIHRRLGGASQRLDAEIWKCEQEVDDRERVGTSHATEPVNSSAGTTTKFYLVRIFLLNVKTLKKPHGMFG
ncbi:hypothetical protein DFH08DRAFT_821377 [Mycena albidolilacea]|uniref:Uncharacterized protein n=1 Tax=Mycena albidolilacea TaxID=1033008 RepID=A0AAD6ZAQ1_9AGAR|nr:hypothetical protein DFH08DRAFT_821377 [Mycena albidolilacea]